MNENTTNNINNENSLLNNSDINIKNLIYLSSQVDINPFNNNKHQLKPKKKIIKECEQIKKKELKNLSITLKNLAKLGSNNTSNIKNIYKSFENKVDNIDKIISFAHNIDTKLNKPLNLTIVDINNKKSDIINVVTFDSGININNSSNKIKKSNIDSLHNQSNSKKDIDYLECFGNC